MSRVLLVVYPTVVAVGVAALALSLIGRVIYRRFPGRFPGFRRFVDRLLTRVPVWRGHYLSVTLARFMRTLAMLLRAGTALDEALTIAGDAAGNVCIGDEAQAAAAAVCDGRRMSSALSDDVWSSGVRWVAVAEERGDLVDSAEGLADYLDEKSEIGGATFLQTVEPLAVLAVGIFCAVVILAAAMPANQLYMYIN